MWKSKAELISTLLLFVLVCTYEMDGVLMCNEVNYTEPKACNSILILTFIRKKTKKMMLRSLTKANYQFWSSGTAFFLPCHSLMATWLRVTSLRFTNVERDFRTHACFGFFFFFCALDKCLQHHRRYSKRSHFSTKQFITMDSSLQESRTDEV